MDLLPGDLLMVLRLMVHLEVHQQDNNCTTLPATKEMANVKLLLHLPKSLLLIAMPSFLHYARTVLLSQALPLGP